MTHKILVTGGAGFIGSHLVDELISNHHEVTVVDKLEEQVHGKTNNPPSYLNSNTKFIKETVVNYSKLENLIKDHEIIYHLAADVGVGQSMYEISKYIKNNILGTANLLDILVNSDHKVKKVIIASSNTIYGEGKYECDNCGTVYPDLRPLRQLKKKEWEVKCPTCDEFVKPLLTDEETPFNSSSIYALSKQVQEQMDMMICNTYGINTTALRFFLVYGPRQSLSNPYTGVCAIFSSRLFSGKNPLVFEDGLQTRDFVNVKDICQALILAMEKNSANGEVFNVGSGKSITIKRVAEILSEKINPELSPVYNNQYRVGDIRHCVADISKIKNQLGYDPKIDFEDGIDDLINWIKNNELNYSDNEEERAFTELKKKGLLK